MPAERGSPAYRRITLALFLAGFATFSLLYCVQPLLPEFAQDFRVSPAESSLALSLSTALLAAAIMAAAAVSEGTGRRGLMAASMALASVLNLAAAGAPGWHALLLLRALEGAALGGVPAVAMAYLAEEVSAGGLGAAMGLYVGGTAFGGMCGRVGAGLLAGALGWRWALGLVGVAGLAASVAFAWLAPESRGFVRQSGVRLRGHADAWRDHLEQVPMRLLYAVGFLVMGAFVAVYNYAGFRLLAPPLSLDRSAASLIFTVYLFGIVASPLAGTLADRVGRRLVLPGAICVEAAGIAMTLLPGLVATIAGLVLLTVGFFAAHAVASAWVGQRAATFRGHAASLYLLAYYLGSSVLGSAAGWWLRADGWPGVAGFTLALLAAALGCAGGLYRMDIVRM